MFNLERLLGSLVNTALSKKFKGRRRTSGHSGVQSVATDFLSQHKAAIGMGILGVAIGAFEHFIPKGQGTPSSPSFPSPQPVAPMPQVPGQSLPPSSAKVNWTPPPLPAQVESSATAGAQQQEAMLLIRAMIASANADHSVDDEERQKILAKIEETGLNPEERSFLGQEFANPLELRSLVDQVKSPELAEQIYVVSLLAIEVDSEAERNYLQRLAKALNVNEAVVTKWRDQLGIQ